MSKNITVPRELVQKMFDLTVGSLDFGSGFWDVEDNEAVALVADLLGVEMPSNGTYHAVKRDGATTILKIEYDYCPDSPTVTIVCSETPDFSTYPNHRSHLWNERESTISRCGGYHTKWVDA